MTAAFEELIHLLDEREIGYATGDDEVVRTDLRGEVASYRIVARVEVEADLFQVFGYSPVRIPEGCRPSGGSRRYIGRGAKRRRAKIGKRASDRDT